MANDPRGQTPFPTARDGATDDDIFAEMGRMLAQDRLSRPGSSDAAPPASASTKVDSTKVDSSEVDSPEEPPLELTQVVSREGGPSAGGKQPPKDEPARGSAQAASQRSGLEATTSAQPHSLQPARQATTVSAALSMLENREDGEGESASGMTVSNRSLDELVQEMLRPMVQEWLDQNLERVVKEHVARNVSVPKNQS